MSSQPLISVKEEIKEEDVDVFVHSYLFTNETVDEKPELGQHFTEMDTLPNVPEEDFLRPEEEEEEEEVEQDIKDGHSANRKATRADMSDGSDIEDIDSDLIENEDEVEIEIPDDPIDRGQWMPALFEDEQEDPELDGIQDEWTTENFLPRKKMPYKRKPGVKIELPNEATPLQVFSHIFTEELWVRIVTETNIYAEQSRRATPSSCKWQPVTVTEVKTFVGLCVAMGILDLPSRRDYWRQKKWLFQTNFHQAMSRDRFDIIWRYLHLQDNDDRGVDRNDKLWKIRWYLDHMTRQFQEIYEVNGFVTLDESMVKYKGRLAFRQYLPHKANKWGIKVWVLAESSTGYVSNFQVYTGRERRTEKGLAHRVAMDLASPYYGSHLSIFMDSFYTGVPLFEDLKARGVDACGVIRADRKGIPARPQQAMEKHRYQVAQKDALSFCAWQDTKVVTVLSNYHDPSATGRVKRKRGGDAQADLTVPACLADYHKHMKGVDLLGQMLGYYHFKHQSQKWWRRLFFFFLSVSCYNSYVVARGVKAYKGLYKDWVEDLAQELITPVTVRSAPMCPPAPLRVSGEHDFGKLFEKRKSCWECSLTPKKGKRPGATLYGCLQCKVAMHTECFSKHIRRQMT